ncbi:hypothetical protein B0H16DRAFT_1509455 [Mycena metata]|uniref:Uncharacterized protein n=1 Tax=Mycena metata TaxID=1033252 RepID=A0AAD7NU43_9AGAR|nr:hypothetical protein B0H16DRAFT_1509455 [Mycena metata]
MDANGTSQSSSPFSTELATTTIVPNTPTSIFVLQTAGSPGHRNNIIWGVVGAVCFVCVAIGILAGLRMWHKRRSRPESVAPSAEYQHRYAPLELTTSQNTLLGTYKGKSSLTGDRNPPTIIIDTPASRSLVSLPSALYDPTEPSYSPAVESSDMFTSQGGHSPADSDRPVSLSHFARLVPLRRAGGRW